MNQIKSNNMKKSDKALELFKSNLSCSQSVLIAMASEVGIDKTLAFRIGAGLGGGIGRTQNICGAINAGAIILGLKYGNYSADDVESKNRMANIVGRFVNECRESLGATQCLDLIKVDLNNKAQKDFANQTGHLAKVCNNAVGETVKILGKYMNEGF
jgi:C_GCAxxG_C_C family probable redox protein